MKDIGDHLLAWDQTLTARLVLPPQASCRRKGAAVGAHLGDGPLWFGGSVVAFIFGNSAVRWLVLLVAVAVLAAITVATVVKFTVRRGRPRETPGFFSVRYDRFSFPSGHATRAACIATVLGVKCPFLAPAAVFAALVVAWARVALGLHYFSDVMVGLFIGVAVSGLILTLE